MTAIATARRGLGLSVPKQNFGLLLAVALFVANIVALPSFVEPRYWPATLAAFAPLALAAMASTPAVLTGGIDLSVSPVILIVNIVVVRDLLPNHWLSAGILLLPISVFIGAAIGVVVGTAVAVLRLPAVLVTLGALFTLSGVAQNLLPNPVSAPPSWLDHLGGKIGPVPGGLVTIVIALVAWWLLDRTPFGTALRAVGSSDTAAASAGTNVTAVRVIAYGFGGALSALAGISYTALVHSADSSNPQQYTVLALAAVALGGTAVTGGAGGLGKSVIGAACIFLIQNLLTSLHVSVFWLDLAYGGALLIAVVAASRGLSARERRSL